jgi:hypothetical protein
MGRSGVWWVEKGERGRIYEFNEVKKEKDER